MLILISLKGFMMNEETKEQELIVVKQQQPEGSLTLWRGETCLGTMEIHEINGIKKVFFVASEESLSADTLEKILVTCLQEEQRINGGLKRWFSLISSIVKQRDDRDAEILSLRTQLRKLNQRSETLEVRLHHDRRLFDFIESTILESSDDDVLRYIAACAGQRRFVDKDEKCRWCGDYSVRQRWARIENDSVINETRKVGFCETCERWQCDDVVCGVD